MSTDRVHAIPFNELVLDDAPSKLGVGETIEAVYYCEVNYPDRHYAFEGFHLCDLGVFFKLSNSKWLSWIWVEDGFSHWGEYEITTADLSDYLHEESLLAKEVSESPDWQPFIGQQISKIEVQLFRGIEFKLISALKLQTNQSQVVVCAIEEPDPQFLPDLEGLPFAQGWTAIVFDRALLAKHRRAF